jgi:hypothetical protein
VCCSDENAGIVLPCLIQQILSSASWAIITTSLPSSTLAINLAFALWDSSSLVVARSFDSLYNFPIIPVVSDIVGCDGPSNEADVPVLVRTINCPTTGGLMMTIIGMNLHSSSLSIKLGEFSVEPPFLPTFVNNSNGSPQTALQFTLPVGSGVDLTITVL